VQHLNILALNGKNECRGDMQRGMTMKKDHQSPESIYFANLDETLSHLSPPYQVVELMREHEAATRIMRIFCENLPQGTMDSVRIGIVSRLACALQVAEQQAAE
jgi:hypothetical protein